MMIAQNTLIAKIDNGQSRTNARLPIIFKLRCLVEAMTNLIGSKRRPQFGSRADRHKLINTGESSCEACRYKAQTRRHQPTRR